MTDDKTPFEGWAVLELMGHRRLGGWVSEQTMAGHGFLRIDVPAVAGAGAFTQLYSPGSLYCLTPTTEQVARAAAGAAHVRPVQPWELERAPEPTLLYDVLDDPEEELSTCPECRAAHDGPDDLCPTCLNRPAITDLVDALQESIAAAKSSTLCSTCPTGEAEPGQVRCSSCREPF